MKSLTQFIKESEDTSKSFTFDLTDIEGAEDFLKSVAEYSDYVSVDGNKFTVKLTSDNIDGFSSAKDAIEKFIKEARSSVKNSANEQYAQKTKKLVTTLDEIKSFIDTANEPEEEPEDNSDDTQDDENNGE